MNKFKIALIYDSGKRYVFDFDVIKETLNLTAEDVAKLEKAILVELSK